MLNIIGLREKFQISPCLLKCINEVHTAVIYKDTEETKTTKALQCWR
jgi:hypothetical protein